MFAMLGYVEKSAANETRHTSAKQNVINGLLWVSNEQFCAENGHAEKVMMCGR